MGDWAAVAVVLVIVLGAVAVERWGPGSHSRARDRPMDSPYHVSVNLACGCRVTADVYGPGLRTLAKGNSDGLPVLRISRHCKGGPEAAVLDDAVRRAFEAGLRAQRASDRDILGYKVQPSGAYANWLIPNDGSDHKIIQAARPFLHKLQVKTLEQGEAELISFVVKAVELALAAAPPLVLEEAVQRERWACWRAVQDIALEAQKAIGLPATRRAGGGMVSHPCAQECADALNARGDMIGPGGRVA